MNELKMPTSRGVLWILLSTLLVSGTAFMAWLYMLHEREIKRKDEQYKILAIVQSTSGPSALKTAYLAELLGLSIDKPVNLFQFDSHEGVQTLLKNPLIKDASIKKILPGTLYVHYQMRNPKAYVGDFLNTAIDEEGILFPFRPFFTPKNLPTLYLGLKDNYLWGASLAAHENLLIAFSLLEQCAQLQPFRLKCIDVAGLQSESYGKRQIIMTLEKQSSPLVYLRLSKDNNKNFLKFFHQLSSYLHEKKLYTKAKSLTIDFRIPQLAFLKDNHE